MRPTALSLAFVLFLASQARAETYAVHPTPGLGDFVSPAEALASPLVMAGDVIKVMPGTYLGTFVIDKAVRLVSTSGAALTVLDGGGFGPVLEISAGATVRGFTITGGGGPLASVGGVKITSPATVRLIENLITGNHPLGDEGVPAGGVQIVSGASAKLRDNEIRLNTSISVGGLVSGGLSTVDMSGDRIHGNGGSGTAIGGVLFGASGRLVNVEVTGNHGTGIGGLYIAGGFPVPAGALVEVTNCTIYGNVGSSGFGSVGGLFLDDGGMVTVRNTLIHTNMGSVGADMALSADFASPPVVGFVDLDYSMVGMPPPVIPGPHMLPPFLDPMLVAPVTATPFGPAPFGDFRPADDSFLLDAGLDAAFPMDIAPLDTRGLTRFFGPAIDIGPFELSPEHVRRASPPSPTPR